MGKMFSALMSPSPGNRTYRIMVMSVVGSFIIAMTGILKGSDLTGLALIVGAFAAAISGMAALNNRGTAIVPTKSAKDS